MRFLKKDHQNGKRPVASPIAPRKAECTTSALLCKRTHSCAKACTSETCAFSTLSFHQLQTVSSTFLTNVRYFVQRIVFAKTSTKKTEQKRALFVYKDTSSAFSMLERLILEPAVQRFLSADIPVFDIQVDPFKGLSKRSVFR